MAKFRTKYQAHFVPVPKNDEPSLTEQQYKDDCSIDGIIRRYGVLPPPQITPVVVDVSEIGDFRESMQKVVDAKEHFAELPATIRERFGHSPESFYNFLADPKNTEEAVKLGLLEVKTVKPDAVDVLQDIAKKVGVTPSGAEPAKSGEGSVPTT